jgi:RND family efflux transporter MFP subunit
MFSSSTSSTAPRRRGWVKIAIVIATLGAGAGGLVAFNGASAKKEEKKPETAKTFEFAANDIVAVASREMGKIIPVTGELRPVVRATIKSKVAAEVARVHVQEGERVAAGQVLVTLDTADLRARHDAQMAAVAEARAKLELARKNQENNKALLAKNFISQNAYDGVANSVTVAEANLKSAQAQAAISERALADANIRSPFAGIVAKRWVNSGDKVSPDGMVAAVVDLSRMELEAQIPVGEIPGIRVGQEINFTVDGFSERKFKGQVERINPSADAGSRSIAIFVTLANPDGALKGGMFANGSMAAASRTSVNAIPLVALIEEGGQAAVFALKDGVIERKPVVIGAKSVEEGLVEIREGLQAGARVVAVKQEGLKHGSKAIIKGPVAAESLSGPAAKS